ncbi:MAG TPA: hypothetical protein VND65_21340 [Candidatus Binatia bacterium]|nr:hypothetical protein [Candidatus Binatia bacterium]
MKLLPAPATSGDHLQAPAVSTDLVPLTQAAIHARSGQISLVPSADTFARSDYSRSSSSPSSSSSSSWARPRGAPFIEATLVQSPSSHGDETGSAWEYVSAWAWSQFAASTAIAHYLSYAAGPGSWSGRFINVYA